MGRNKHDRYGFAAYRGVRCAGTYPAAAGKGDRAHIRHDRHGVFLGHCRRGGGVSLPEGRAGRPAERRCRADRQLCMHRARHSAIDVRHKSRRCAAARKAGAHLVCASAACRERRCCGFGTDARGRLPVGTAACRDGRGHVYRTSTPSASFSACRATRSPSAISPI